MDLYAAMDAWRKFDNTRPRNSALLTAEQLVKTLDNETLTRWLEYAIKSETEFLFLVSNINDLAREILSEELRNFVK